MAFVARRTRKARKRSLLGDHLLNYLRKELRMLGCREMPAGHNSDVEAMGAQTLPRGYSLLAFDLVLFAADDVERHGTSRCME